ncbi:CaiB/BaiF CoA transferase family protein [Halovivax gelatinilyticus]|uniref:CaiB/BaiF CoA transferase family protein n=1 Tax=Halovivax gelatinilyticus TaxID=2961597 RepID=UPI0020CA533E|nr:CaiB/BaiF CoA-transferase family protein [Halovivax gelatinilyticus]
MHPLDGITVLSLESGVSAPLCTRQLGDLGAEVIKVERPGVGDNSRHWDNAVNGESSAHVWVNRNKRSLTLNLKRDEGAAVFRDLAAESDVVVQNFAPGAVDRLGFDYESLRDDDRRDESQADLIYVNISGYGRSGPYRDRKAYDMVMQGETGLILSNGSPDAPAKIPLSICDINAAMYATIGTITALYQRAMTGEGQELDVTMFGGVLSWLGYFPQKYWHEGEIPDRVGMRHHLLTPYGPHETADGDYINFAVLSEDHFEIFCRDVLERPDLLDDERFEGNESRIAHRETFESIVESEIADRDRDYWADRLQTAGIPWGDVNQIDEVLNHPQAEHLGLVKTIEAGDEEIPIIDNPIDFGAASVKREAMPDLGADSVDLLSSLGYSAEEIARLEADGVI